MTETSVTVVEGLSQFGNAEVRLQLAFPAGTSYRYVNSRLYAYAAEIERLSSEEDPWCLVVDKEHRSVHLELVYDSNSPVSRDDVVRRGVSRLRLVLLKQ